jgi:hypothetical protein
MAPEPQSTDRGWSTWVSLIVVLLVSIAAVLGFVVLPVVQGQSAGLSAFAPQSAGLSAFKPGLPRQDSRAAKPRRNPFPW